MPDPAAVIPSDTRAQVKQAADALLTDGIRPTVANVRERIGRGSATTINEALKEWWWELAERLSQISTRPDIPEPVFEIASQLWDTALQEGSNAFSHYRAEADAAVESARAEVQSALLTRQQAEARATALEQQLTEAKNYQLELERRLAAETERSRQAAQRIDELHIELERQRQQAQQLAKHQAQELALERGRHDSLERRLTAQIDEQKTARERLEKQLAARETEWREREKGLQALAEDARHRESLTAVRIAQLEQQLAQMATIREALQSEKEALTAQTATLRAELGQMKGQLERLEKELSARDRQLETSRLEHDGAAKQIHNMQIQLAALEAENRTLKAALTFLGPSAPPRTTTKEG